MNLVWVTFFFGAGQPILFPITLAGLIFQYISERFRMTYSYTKPPMYDSRLTSHTLKYLGVAPFLYVIFSCWLFSNQQVFMNTVSPIVGFNLYPLQEHKFVQFWTQITPATPFLIWLLGFIVIQIFKYCWSKCR